MLRHFRRPNGVVLSCAQERVARRAGLVVAIVALVCLFFNDVIFLGRTFGAGANAAQVMGIGKPAWGFTGQTSQNLIQIDPGASEFQIVPWARQIARAYSLGGLPLWNPHQGFGSPLAAGAQAGPFDVLRIPPFLTAAPVAWDVYFVARAILGLVLAHGFARSVGLSTAAGLYLAIAYTFSGFMLIRGNNAYIEVYYLLPAILWGTECLLRGQTRLGLVATSVAIAMAHFAGMPESAILVLGYAAAYGMYRCVCTVRVDRSLSPALKLAGAWLAGNCLAAPVLVPFAEYVQQSVTVHGADRQLGLVHLAAGGSAFLGVPYFAFSLDGAANELDNYSGAAVLAFAGVGAILVCRRARLPGHAGFALSAGVVVAAKLYGAPLVNDLGRFPLLNLTTISIWGGPLLIFSLAFLGAHAVHALSQRQRVVHPVDMAGGLALFGAYLGLALLLNRGAWDGRDGVQVAILFGFAALVGVEAIILPLLVRRRQVRLGGFVACGIVTVELFLLAPHGSRPERYDPFTEPPFVRFLLSQSETSQPFRTFGTNGVLYPNSPTAFGLDDIRALDALYPGRYFKYVDAFLQPMYDRFTGHQEFAGQTDVETEGNIWLDLTGVRYIVSASGTYPAGNRLVDSVLAESVLPPTTRSVFVIGGQPKSGWSALPPAQGHSTFTVDATNPRLRFSIALDPDAPEDKQRGGGVQFSVLVDDGSQKHEVYRHVLNSRPDASAQRWVDGAADLSAYAGKRVELDFRTEQSELGAADRAVWSDIRLEAVDQKRLVQVFSGGADVYENRGAFPRAFVVGRVVGAANQDEAVDRMKDPEFDPARVAVVDGAAGDELARMLSNEALNGSVDFQSYTDQRVRLSVSSVAPGLLILTDVYFPGWQAWLDGQPAQTYPTDLAFRGVLVPGGTHVVEFVYTPASFLLGMVVAGLAVAGLGGVLLVPTVSRRRVDTCH